MEHCSALRLQFFCAAKLKNEEPENVEDGSTMFEMPVVFVFVGIAAAADSSPIVFLFK